MRKIACILYTLTLAAAAGCGSQGATNAAAPAESAAERSAPSLTEAFSADSAYSFVASQVAFGPRVPNTEAHRACGDWLVEKLRQYGASNITEQYATLRAYDGTALSARNITASINPEAEKRVLLLSHWDSRPWADQESDPAARNKPIDGANDGASGVGVILEVVRCLAQKAPQIGVDVLFTDAEDYGTRADDTTAADTEDSWCLGTRHWVESPTLDLSKIRYAVLLDMVGGRDAVFAREYFSQYAHPDIVDRVWKAARQAGQADRFANHSGAPIVDDHLPLIRAGVPAIDIIETNNPQTQSFNPTWHTHADNIGNIDPKTLGAVGQTLLQLIYSE